MNRQRRRMLAAAVGGTLGWTGASARRARAGGAPLRIGYTMSLTGPYATGAAITQAPNYALWEEQVNGAGGVLVRGEGRRRVELLSLDDRSDTVTAARIYEEMIRDDGVDLLLAPWGTALSFAAGEVASRHGFPLIAPTAVSNRVRQVRFPYLYCILQQRPVIVSALAGLLESLRKRGAISKVGVAFVNDAFGIDLRDNLVQLLNSVNFPASIVEGYPLTTKDLAPLIERFRAAQVDAFVGLTYPGDNSLLSSQARQLGFNPPLYFTGVGTAFPDFREEFHGAEGVTGIAGWNPKVKYPGARAYFDAHVKRQGREPDRWASAFTYASLQILERCLEEVGRDRAKIKQMLDRETFQTVAGPIRFVGRANAATPGMVGQWQKGEFEIVWPESAATASLVVPKPRWT